MKASMIVGDQHRSCMEGLRLIGAGFGRTGTTSLMHALERLGYGPCYHMRVAMTRPGHARFWIRVKQTESVDDLRQFLSRYRATVDWPACEFYKELMLAFPDAKVLLNVWDADAWYDSMRSTIFAVKQAIPWWFPPSILRMHDAVIWNGRLNGHFSAREAAFTAYYAHIEEVRRTVPADRTKTGVTSRPAIFERLGKVQLGRVCGLGRLSVAEPIRPIARHERPI